jgi:hypothetical protein
VKSTLLHLTSVFLLICPSFIQACTVYCFTQLHIRARARGRAHIHKHTHVHVRVHRFISKKMLQYSLLTEPATLNNTWSLGALLMPGNFNTASWLVQFRAYSCSSRKQIHGWCNLFVLKPTGRQSQGTCWIVDQLGINSILEYIQLAMFWIYRVVMGLQNTGKLNFSTTQLWPLCFCDRVRRLEMMLSCDPLQVSDVCSILSVSPVYGLLPQLFTARWLE